jgi:hypothetical protein
MSDAEAIQSALAQYLSAPRSVSVDKRPVSSSGDHSIGPLSDRLIRELDRTPSASFAKLERIVQEALEATGNMVAASDTQSRLHADFAVWGDGFDPVIGNPLLVEVKRRLTTSDVGRLGTLLRDANARCLLVLYVAGNAPKPQFGWSVSPTGLVLFRSLRDFLKELKVKPLSRLVTEARNQVVHGIA